MLLKPFYPNFQSMFKISSKRQSSFLGFRHCLNFFLLWETVSKASLKSIVQLSLIHSMGHLFIEITSVRQDLPFIN